MKYLIAVIIFLFVIGCYGGGDFYDPYYGSEGLYMEFLLNAPPYFVYELQEIPVGILVKNYGASDINRGVMVFSYEEDYLEKIQGDDLNLLLMGRSVYNPEGEERVKMFYFKTKKLDKLSKIHDTQIVVSACYEYETRLSSNICIDPDVYNLLEGEKPCYVEDKSFSGQGAPVAVTYVSESIVRDRDDPSLVIPTFEITIENVGGGNVIDFLSVEKYCGPEDFSKSEFGTVDVSAKVASKPLSCYPNPVKINSEGRTKTMCNLIGGLEDTGSAYSSILEVDLLYGYAFSISKEFTIQKSLG